MKKLIIYLITVISSTGCYYERWHVKCDNGFNQYVKRAYIDEGGTVIYAVGGSFIQFSPTVKCEITMETINE